MINLINELVEICKDYREDDDFYFDFAHVQKWINQFSNYSRVHILSELVHLLSETYVSKNKLYDFFDDVIEFLNENYKGRVFKLLNCQNKGNSQREMKEMLEDYIYQNSINFGSEDGDDLWIYLDDFMFTGNTIVRDILQLEQQLDIDPRDVVVIVIATHTKAEYYCNMKIPLVSIIRERVIDNYKLTNSKEIQVIWPNIINSDLLDMYIKRLEQQHEHDPYPTKELLFRPDENGIRDNFLNEESRIILEREFIINGINIINCASNPNKSMKPLGFDYKMTLGFGSLSISYRNCANNCPLVLWYGEIVKGRLYFDDQSPLHNWYPLFPRKTNKKGGFAWEI